MSRNLIILMILAVVSFVFGCNDKAPACSTLSWGETKVEETGFDLKYSAGDQCENINDYWDVDIEDIIFKILKMKLMIDKCVESVADETVDCPEFVPESIEFNELTGCRFGTPPDEESLCLADPLDLYFSTDSFFETVHWTFNVENEDDTASFASRSGDKLMTSYEFSLSDLSALVIYTWSETSDEGVEEERKIYAEYSVKTKE